MSVMLECPFCKTPIDGFDLVIKFAIVKNFREKICDAYVLQPCGHELNPGVEMHDAMIDEDGTFETWLHDPFAKRGEGDTMVAWLDRYTA